MKNKKTAERLLLEVLKKMVEKDIRYNMEVWPPPCMSLLHQPKRPK